MDPPTHSTSGLGLIEVHSHLIPAVDDGSRSVEESIAIGRLLVDRGYGQLVCTPHIWPDLPDNHKDQIISRVRSLQADFTSAGVPLTLHPGGEISLRPHLATVDPDTLPTYANLGKHFLVDTWIWKWESWLTPVIKHLQQGGRAVILAHPERLGMLQADPALVTKLQDLGVLLQGNLYCFADDPSEPTRQLADRYLSENRYFMLGGDLHRLDTIDSRFAGLEKVLSKVGVENLRRLLKTNPQSLLTP